MKSFNITELQTISYSCAILRTCDGVQPFALANKINSCGIVAEEAIKTFNGELELIREREQGAKDQDQIRRDLDDLVNKKFDINLPELNESAFAILEITGDKEIPQQDGSTKKLGYRDAYFSLLNIGIIKHD